MSTTDINIFISYSHDSPQHEARVLALADQLRTDGLNCIIDQYDDEQRAEGWPLWMEQQIRSADFVLMVFTETYYRRVMNEELPGTGLGARWEGNLSLQHLYNSGAFNIKFIPIVFAATDTRYIPTPVQGATYYRLDTPNGYEALYRRLTNQPLTPKNDIGTIRKLPPRARAPLPLTGAATPPPAPPNIQPNLVHPYAMQANFTGRVDERRQLTAWLADDAHPICALIAMGGMGKSALSWYWMQHDILPAAQPAAAAIEGVMWWSFYEGESSFAKFIDEALKYASGQPTIDTEQFPTPYDRAQELRKHLQHKRVLFVLDGFERQLRAYARLDAAYQQDDTANPPRDERACVDPLAARLLYDIAAGSTRAKLLITTRLMVHDLEDRAGGALAGVLKRDLKEMPPADALTFMHAQGVTKGTPAEIANACADYGYHPLSLRLLSGLIANDTRKPGDIAAAPRHDVHADLIQSQHHVLQQSYDAIPKRERALLSRIAAFRSPMTYDTLLIFNTLGNETRFDAALEDLRVRGLLQRDTKKNRYDLHPIVRRYAYDRLNDKTRIHTQLRDYFATIPTLGEDKVRSIEDLLPLIELYHHTTRAGRYDEALKLFSDRLNDLLYYRFGAFQTYIELLLALFIDGKDNLPRLKVASDKGWTLNSLAISYGLSGQPRAAMHVFQLGNEIANKGDDKLNLALGLGNIAMSSQVVLGELAAAEQNLLHSIELCREMKQEWDEAIGHVALGWLLSFRGAFAEAESELTMGQEVFDRIRITNFTSVVRALRALRALLMGDARAALDMAREARTLADEFAKTRYPVERDFIQAEWLSGAALVMEGKDLDAAAAHLAEALMRCRRINLVELEPDILLAWARLFRTQGKTQEAQTYAEEALAIADRCEYRLKQAEIHNFLGRVWLEAGEKEEAKEQAEIAKERAWCDGPPHSYKVALDEAEETLKELGVGE